MMIEYKYHIFAIIFIATLLVFLYRLRKDIRFDRQHNIRTPWYKQPSIVMMIAFSIFFTSILLIPLSHSGILPKSEIIYNIELADILLYLPLLLYSLLLQSKKYSRR